MAEIYHLFYSFDGQKVQMIFLLHHLCDSVDVEVIFDLEVLKYHEYDHYFDLIVASLFQFHYH